MFGASFQGQNSALAAGEEPNVGQEQDNYLAFEAHLDTVSGGGTTSGSLVVYWPNAPGGSAGCSSNTSWPLLDTVTLLGVPTADPDSVTVLVRALPCTAWNAMRLIKQAHQMGTDLSHNRICSFISMYMLV